MQVLRKQEFIASHFGSKHALQTPPHITIIPPIAIPADEESIIRKLAEKISQLSKPFTLEINGYGSFRPRVVFMRVLDSALLTKLHFDWRKELNQALPHTLDKYPERPYHPHMTLAHRDVTPIQFKNIWNHYRDLEYKTEFEVTGFWILKHNQSGWQKEIDFNFK